MGGVCGKNGGVWAKIENVGKECMLVGKGVISLGKEDLMMLPKRLTATLLQGSMCFDLVKHPRWEMTG